MTNEKCISVPKLDYILELDDRNSELFKKMKLQIIEKTFLHHHKQKNTPTYE